MHFCLNTYNLSILVTMKDENGENLTVMTTIFDRIKSAAKNQGLLLFFKQYRKFFYRHPVLLQHDKIVTIEDLNNVLTKGGPFRAGEHKYKLEYYPIEGAMNAFELEKNYIIEPDTIDRKMLELMDPIPASRNVYVKISV